MSQYHAQKGGEKTKIMLGYFDENLHKQWLDEMQATVTKANDKGEIAHISHMYSRGDVCSDAGTLRHVFTLIYLFKKQQQSRFRSCEVRMSCRVADSKDADYQTINMHIVEPTVCNYVLHVESALFCGRLKTADKNGLLTTSSSSSSSKTSDTAAEIVAPASRRT